MRLNGADPHRLITTLEDLARQKGYGKIFAKVPEPAWPAFQSADYVAEAVVPGFFSGRTDGYFISKYFSEGRHKDHTLEKRLGIARPEGEQHADPLRRGRWTTRHVVACQPSDAEQMSDIYHKVFRTYPFPIQKPGYLKRMMKEGVRYFCIRIDGRIAAIAAAEIDCRNENAEMTDFATLPEWRGLGLAGMLLRHMDHKMRDRGIKTAYTIARAASHGMNAVFRNKRYLYAGLLKNNTQISGQIESMTVWYKPLRGPTE
jgi:putative beta-lysine N-acetyltransferase